MQKRKLLNSILKVVIIIARCSHTKQAFGIRFEEKAKGQWIADWAFAVKETYASKEGYDRNTIIGTFMFDTSYSGCPYCQAKSIYKCSCGKVNCWDGQTNIVICSWCAQTVTLGGQIEMLNAGEDY